MKNFITLCLWALIPTLLMLPEAKAQPVGWQFFIPVEITEQSGTLLTDYQLRLELNTQSLIGGGSMQADGDDIRFGLDVMGNTLLNYWIESGLNTPTTVIWVKVPALAASAVTTIYLFYGNNSAPGVSNIDGTFVGPHSSTDSVAPINTGGQTNSQRGFRFAPNEDILVKRFGKNEPNGSTRYVTLFDFSTQAIVRQHQVSGPAGQYSYSDLSSPLWLTQSTQYLLIMYQGATDGYYFGVSSQIGQHLTYYDMRFCNFCNQNTFPTSVLAGWQYGYPDFHYYTKQNISPAPTYVVACPTFSAAPANVSITNSTCNSGIVSGGSITAPTGTPCPAGSTLQYNVNNGGWTSTLPAYNQTGPAQSIVTRCSCESDPNTVSAESVTMTTVPGVCPDPCTTPIETITCESPKTATLSGSGAGWSPNSCGFSTPGAEKVYSFTPTVTGNHTLQVTAADGTYINYFFKDASGGCGATGWTCIDDIFSAGSVTFGPLTAGTTYLILLDDESMVSSTQTFQINCPAPPVDPCAAPIETIACASPKTATLSGSGAGWSPNSCGFSTPGAEKVYSFTPTTTGNHVLQVTAADGTYINYFFKDASGGCGATGWTCIDDIFSAGSVTFGPLTAGTTYLILLDDESMVSSTQTFQINCPAPPVNDACANAAPISCGTTVSGSNVNATDEPGAFTPCGVVQTTAGAWYTFTGDGSTVTLSTCSAASFDTKISVYSGGCVTPTCVTGNDDSCPDNRSSVTFIASNGTVYLILIHGFAGATGTFDLSMTCMATCPTFSAAPANVSITNSSCNASCQTIPGSITAPAGTPCPAGSTLQYSVASGPWTTNLPMYAGLTSTDSIKTRCLCDANPAITSPVSPAISVNPANCADVTPPSVNCSNMTVTFNGQESISLNVNALATATDNCSTPSLSISPSSITCQQVGQQVPVTVTATDLSNNTATCTSTITVGGLPCGWSQNPDGVNCEAGNSIAYNSATGVWTATSTNCYYASPFTADETAFAQRALCGNGSITALVTSISGTALGWAGVVMRESNAAGAKKAQLTTNLSNFSRREFRTATNGSAIPQQFPSLNRYWLRLVRTGNQFAMYVSPNGTAWYFVGTQNIVMNNCIQMGLVATNYQQNSTVTATFSNVSFTGSNSMLGAGGSIEQMAESLRRSSTGAKEGSLEQPHDFEAYPNPTGGVLNVDLTSYVGKTVRLEVYSLEGKLLQFREIDEVQMTVEQMDISNLSNGLYLLKAKSAGIPDMTNRVVLQKD